MPSIRRFGFSWVAPVRTVSTRPAGVGTFVPVTGWMPAVELARVRATCEPGSDPAGSPVALPGYQAGSVETGGDTPAVPGTGTQTPVAAGPVAAVTAAGPEAGSADDEAR